MTASSDEPARRPWLRVFTPLAVALVVTTFVAVPLASGRAERPPAIHAAARVSIPSAAHAAATTVDAPRSRPSPQPTLATCPRAASACVDTRHRVAWLQQDGRTVYGPVPVGLGRPGHRTPVGTFHVAYKGPHWVSTEYGIPMPWAVFFAAGGIAFHQGSIHQQSHGCVHLRAKDARKFYAALEPGDEVFVR